MTGNYSLFPKQRESYSKKSANDFKWAKNVMDSLEDHHTSQATSVYNTDGYTEKSNYERKLSNYRLFNNILDQKDFARECNPFGLSEDLFKDSIQAYNKIPNKINVLLSEEARRPFNYKAVLVNDDGIKSKQVELTNAMRSKFEQGIELVIELLREQLAASNPNQDPEQAQQLIDEAINEMIDPDDLERFKSTTFLSQKEIAANQILTYLTKALDTRSKMNDGFKHALLTGEEYVWVGPRAGNPTVDVLNTLGEFHYKSPDVKYVQDGLYAGYKTVMDPGMILDLFGEHLSNDDIDFIQGESIDNEKSGKDSGHKDYPNTSNARHMKSWYDQFTDTKSSTGAYGPSNRSTDWEVAHMEWRSQKKIYFVTTHTEDGDESKFMVGEDFIIPDYATTTKTKDLYNTTKTIHHFDEFSVEESWVPEIWEGVKIGDNKYCCIGPKPFQKRSIEDPTNLKLGYHGLVYSSMNAAPICPVDRMKPFQYLYFILVDKLKRLIARDKGKVYHFDVTMLPENMSLDKAIYYLEELDIDFYNPLANADVPGANSRAKISTATDRSNSQYINNYIGMMEAIDQQISDIAGIPKAREGQTQASEAVTNVQQNLLQSGLVTGPIINAHFKLWEEIYTSLVNLTQAMYKDKKFRKQFVLDDLSVQNIEVSPDLLSNADFGVFVSNTSKDTQVFDTLKQLSQALLQNDKAKLSDIVKIVKATSVEQLERDIAKSEKDMETQVQQDQQFQQEMQQAQAKAAKELQEDIQSHELDKLEYERETEIILKSMEAGQNDFKNELEVAKLKQNSELKNKELDIKKTQTESKNKKPQ
jgi:hypothetical protein